MKYETAELEGDALDYMVRCAESGKAPLMSVAEWTCSNIYGYNPSRNWDQAGPIIEGEEMRSSHYETEMYPGEPWHYWTPSNCTGHGFTPLIAAMRAYVASKLGPEVELPD